MDQELVRFSKFLSLLLRHEPQRVGLTLDSAGWVAVDELLAAVNRSGWSVTRAILQRVVAENDKQRFRFSEDGLRIRASQGHSVEVALELPPKPPPELLYHGTAGSYRTWWYSTNGINYDWPKGRLAIYPIWHTAANINPINI